MGLGRTKLWWRVAVSLPDDIQRLAAHHTAHHAFIPPTACPPPQWVARYRRDDRFAGKPSFSNLYSAVNALAGHYNSFGATTRIPAKRLDRVKVELDLAQRLVGQGR